jgi:hypothetical protein
VDVIGEQDVKGAVNMVNPEQVKEYGAKVTEAEVRMKYGYFRRAENSGVKLQVDTVKILDGGIHADVVPEIRVNNDWRKREQMDWIEVEGEWYVHFKNVPTEEQPQPDQPRERPQGDHRPRPNKGDRN